VIDAIRFERHVFRLRFTAQARFSHFLHGGVVHGLLGRALDSRELPGGILPSAPESGRMVYAPGEHYHFGLTILHEFPGIRADVEKGLRAIGAQRDLGRGLPLGGNFALEETLTLPPVDLAAEIATLHAEGVAGLRFVTPLRLERPTELREKGAGYLDRRCFPLGHFLDRLWRRLYLLAHGRWPTEAEREGAMPPLPERGEADPAGLLWIDLPHPERGRTLGGALGRVRCSGISEPWLPLLILGRHLHAGSSTHFGFGRFVIDGLGPLEEPARWLYDRLAEPERLERALDHIVEKSVAGGVDRVSPERFAEERTERIPELAAKVAARRVEVAPLLGLPVRREDRRKVRPLTIPTVADRVLQRAAVELLGPAVDTLFEDCSFAYRKGFSRAGAAKAIQAAYRDGFRVVLDADISAFFEEVRWDRLFAMLDALFPGEKLLDLIHAWVEAPVLFEGMRIRRRGGLPQGAPISPLLANLYLDELDDEVLGDEFRLVRYADDFVVLCRDLESAGRARDTVEAALTGLGLELNEDETSIRSLDEGLEYLGFLFCRSLVLEPAGDGELAPPEAGDPVVPPRSWLAQVPLDRVKALLDERAAGGGRPPQVEAVAIGGERAEKRALYVVSVESKVFLREGRLVVETADGEPTSIPTRHISHVVVLGTSRMTVPVLLSLDTLGVPVYFCHRTGELRARWEPHAPDWPLWLAQARRREDEGARLWLARELVGAKLANQATLLVRHRFEGAEETAKQIRALAADASSASSMESVRGFEGASARAYFELVRAEFGPAWGFTGRRHRPPPDPVNALLSFISTLLHHHVSTALVAAGLNPRLGLFHEPRGTHHALASDLQEELRFLADGTVWALLRRREIKPEDFVERPGASYPVLLTPDARRRVIASFERRLLTEVELEAGAPRRWREIVDRQAGRLRDWIVDPDAAPYRAIRAHG
jgi:CRISPR-associated protein Cas1